jgi:hypothetical protein
MYSFILKGKYSVFSLCFLSRVEYQLPNLIVGAVTKESIYGAFENGITAEQVHLYNTNLGLLVIFKGAPRIF